MDDAGSHNLYLIEHARRVLVPLFAFVRMRVSSSGQYLKLLWGGLALLALGGVIWAVLATRPDRPVAHVVDTYISRPLTTYPGSELQPSFSPDGSAVAFVWLKEGERFGHTYVKLLGSEAPARLTAGIAEELSPAWSPDGRWIAFIRHDDTESSVDVIPAIGGSEEEIYKLPTNHVWDYGGGAWTQDGPRVGPDPGWLSARAAGHCLLRKLFADFPTFLSRNFPEIDCQMSLVG